MFVVVVCSCVAVGGDMDKPTSQMRRLFDTITDCGVKWAPCDADFDIISFGKRELRVNKGVE